MNEKIWNHWIKKWNWVRDCILHKGCKCSDIAIHPPIDEQEVIEFEESTGLRLPEDYKTTITQFAGAIDFSWYLSLENDFELLPDDHPTVINFLRSATIGWAQSDMSEEEMTEKKKFMVKTVRKKIVG